MATGVVPGLEVTEPLAAELVEPVVEATLTFYSKSQCLRCL